MNVSRILLQHEATNLTAAEAANDSSVHLLSDVQRACLLLGLALGVGFLLLLIYTLAVVKIHGVRGCARKVTFSRESRQQGLHLERHELEAGVTSQQRPGNYQK